MLPESQSSNSRLVELPTDVVRYSSSFSQQMGRCLKRYCFSPSGGVKGLAFLLLGAMLGAMLASRACRDESCGGLGVVLGWQSRAERALGIGNMVPVAVADSSAGPLTTPPPLSKLHRPKTLDQELTIRKPLLIGVVTAQILLKTRATAVYNTWGTLAPKIIFFSSPGENYGLPVVSLPNVDDTYPPQKKVYYMLKYMYDNYLDDYNWFLRADDDVYVRTKELVDFLSQLDPSEPLYMGQPGLGKPEDRERLKLFPHECYCMGGPGILYSNGLLRRLGPHLEECLQNVVVSYNEDVEVGRCVSRRVGVQCTWSYQMAKLFFMDFTKGAVFNSSKVYQHKDLPSVLTVHSFKQPEEMFRIHQFYLELQLEAANKKLSSVKEELTKWQGITKREKAYP